MRADRLVAVLMLLQTRGQVTAAEVAAELEVSERTARRDLEALGVAGLPVYSQQGRHGGWRLAGSGKTDLSGLTAAEARALFLVAGPASAAPDATSATPALRAALRKLVRALPESFREHAETASSSVLVDPAGWDGRPPRPTPPFLDAVQRAVIEREQLELGYVNRDRASSTRRVQPLGLAAKGSAWYLVAGTADGLRTFRVDRVTSVEPTGERVERPRDFDMAAAWSLISDRVEQMRLPVAAIASCPPEVLFRVRMIFGNRVRIGAAGDDGRVALEVRGHHEEELASQLAGFGSLLDVEGPPALCAALARIGRELSASYGRRRPAARKVAERSARLL